MLLALLSFTCNTHAGAVSVPHRLLCLQGSYGGDAEIVGLEWYHGQEGFCQPGCPVLAVCLRTGQMQLMTDELDDSCLLVNTGMQVSSIKWNSNGSVLAVSGVIANNGSAAAAVVQFYSCYGEPRFCCSCVLFQGFCLARN